MNIWMIGKTSIIHHYLKRKYFYSHLSKGDVADADYAQAKNARTSL